MIIDFRSRPPTDKFKQFFKPEFVVKFHEKIGVKTPASYLSGSVEEWIREMKEAGIVRAVVNGRNINGPVDAECIIPNEYLSDLQTKYSPQIIALAGIDTANVIHNALEETEKAISKLGMKGVAIDPGLSAHMMYPSDRRIYPIYRKCVELDVPILLMGGPLAGGDLSFTDPVHIDRVAADFPSLRIICGHGFYPYVTEVIGVAFRRRNVYITPDVYLFFPGGDQYVQAANKILSNQIVFATSYPHRPFKETVEEFNRLPFRKEVLPKLLYDNAAKIFGLAT
jgi:predicted TIM-barrel fold metal-dependent hydrolase